MSPQLCATVVTSLNNDFRCGAPAGSDSSVADIFVPDTGRYLAAAMLITVQPVNHANVLSAEAEVLLFTYLLM